MIGPVPLKYSIGDVCFADVQALSLTILIFRGDLTKDAEAALAARATRYLSARVAALPCVLIEC